jgi:uncharacterized protein YidB (DUF937 family)
MASQKAYNGLMRKIEQETKNAGMTSGMKAIEDLDLLTDAQKKAAIAAEEWKETIVDAWSLIDKVSPIDKMKREMQGLDELFANGDITKSEYAKGYDKLIMKAKELTKLGPKTQSLEVGGSSESVVSIINAQQNAKESPMQVLAAFAEEQLQEEKAQNKNLEMILQAFNKNDAPVVFQGL